MVRPRWWSAAPIEIKAKAWSTLESKVQLYSQRVLEGLVNVEAKRAFEDCMLVLGRVLAAAKGRFSDRLPVVRLFGRGHRVDAWWTNSRNRRVFLVHVVNEPTGQMAISWAECRLVRGRTDPMVCSAARCPWKDTLVDKTLMPELRELFYRRSCQQ